MRNLKHFCTPLQWGTLLHVTLQWQRCFRDEYDLMSQFLYPTDDLATSYPGRDVPWDEGYRVVIHQDGTIVGIDDEDFDNRLTLMRSDIIRYRFDLKQFRRETSPILGLKPDETEIDRNNCTILWGVWEPEKGAAFPVRLLLLHFQDNLKEQLYEMIVNRHAPGEMILTPTRDDWKDGIEELARKNKLLLVPLDEIFQEENGKILPTPEWNEYLTAFCKMIEMDLPSSLQQKTPEAAQYEFRRKGQMWVLRFDGKEMFLKDGVGPQHISVLLSQPGRSIYAVDLQMLAAKQDTATAPRPTAAGEMSDAATIREVESRARELLADLDVARRDGNSILESEIEDEIDQLKNYLCQVKGIDGEARKSNNPADSIRRSVQQMIKKTIDTIGLELPDCASHLAHAIRTGFVVSYNPTSEVQWVL